MWWSTAFATTWNIPTDFATIEVAMQSGHVVAGDKLDLEAGVHQGFTDFESTAGGVPDLEIRGVGPNTILVAPPGSNTVLESVNTNLEIRDLRIWGEGLNRCLWLESAVFDIQEVEIYDCVGLQDAGGMIVQDATVFGEDVDFSNSSGGLGGAVSLSGFSTVDLIFGTFTGNAATQGGGGISLSSNSQMIVRNYLFEQNNADRGGAVQVFGQFQCQDCIFYQNTAEEFGGAITGTGHALVEDAQFLENSATLGGGAIGGAHPMDYIVERSVFRLNTASEGGAATLRPGTSTSFTNVAFCENTADEEGHAVHIPTATASTRFDNVLFRGNEDDLGEIGALTAHTEVVLEQAFFTSNNNAIDTTGPFAMHFSVVQGGSVSATGPAIDVSENLIGSGYAFTGPDPHEQIFDFFTVVGGSCLAGSRFAWPSHAAVPGPPRLSHLGGPLFDVDFWGADQDQDSYTIIDDCDDNHAGIYPGAPEQCDGHDNDCNHQIDDGAGSLWYEDIDEDTYGDENGTPIQACSAPPDRVDDNTDCNDDIPAINPAAQEVCDSTDHNCDGHPDQGLPFVDYYADGDGDGYGTGPAISACVQPPDTAIHTGDCADGDPNRNPGVVEICNAVDDNCDGHTDENFSTPPYYADLDGDGWGTGPGVPACQQPPHTSLDNGDCADDDANRHPEKTEVCDGVDQDCDGHIDEHVPTFDVFVDADGDGFGTGSATQACRVESGMAQHHGDCDDAVDTTYPGAVETCNGVDDDCDGTHDNDVTALDWYLDLDGDGFGAGAITSLCSQPTANHVLLHGDCADGDPDRHPDAIEDCGGQDLDCDGELSNGVATTPWYPDVDGDSFGSGTAVVSCAAPPQHVAAQGDCDETDVLINPDGVEVCDGADNDCNGDTDDDDAQVTGRTLWYLDDDGDTFGDVDHTLLLCDPPAAYVDRHGDCDDTNENVYVGAPEACADGVDNDCDGLVDGDDPDYDGNPITFAADADGDGFGDPFDVTLVCPGSQPLGWIPLGQEDCNDSLATVNPGEPEVCDNLDNNCDNQVNENLPYQDTYPDADGDLFGDENGLPISNCEIPPGRVTNASDCDDTDSLTNPLTPEICDGLDQNCSGFADEDLPTTDWYPDADGDGFGDIDAIPVTSCAVEPGVDDHRDCDDSDPTRHPGAVDAPDDGFDSDCDGTEETIPNPMDTDGDGVPDPIDVDPGSAGSAPLVTPSEAEYGCGCTTPTPLLTWLRRR